MTTPSLALLPRPQAAPALRPQEPEARLGVRGRGSDLDAILSHAYFAGFDWAALRRGALPAPLCPQRDGVPPSRAGEPLGPHRVAELDDPVPEGMAAAFAYVDAAQVEADLVARLRAEPEALADLLGGARATKRLARGSQASSSCACTVL